MNNYYPPEYSFVNMKDYVEAQVVIYSKVGKLSYNGRGNDEFDAKINVSKIAYKDIDENYESMSQLLVRRKMYKHITKPITLSNAVSIIDSFFKNAMISIPVYEVREVYDSEAINKTSYECQLRIESINIYVALLAATESSSKDN